ncbi:MAG: hypothetical protein AAFO73_03635, partial [Pseudomonadota bacterium]
WRAGLAVWCCAMISPPAPLLPNHDGIACSHPKIADIRWDHRFSLSLGLGGEIMARRAGRMVLRNDLTAAQGSSLRAADGA